MRLSFTLLAGASALLLSGFSAQAGCADPRLPAQHRIPHISLRTSAGVHVPRNGSAADNIVGTWRVTYTVENNPFGDALIQWHSDGTEWENIDFPPSSGNLCMGSWKAIDGKHVYRSHIGWIYNDNQLVGYFTETETDKVARDGNSYAGTNEQKVYDLDGNLLADVTGTSSATRIAP